MYLPLTAATPQMVRLAKRRGWHGLLAIAASIVIVDAVQALSGLDFVGWLNLPLVWLATAQAGVTAALRPAPPRWTLALTAAGAFVLLLVVAAAGWYPVAMISVGSRSNVAPPTAALALLATVQLCAVWCWRAPLRALAARATARRAVGVFGAIGMHVYLWHLSVIALLIGLQRLGVFTAQPLTAGWWATRPVVIPMLLLVVVALAAAVGRLDLHLLDRGTPGTGKSRGLAAMALGTTGCGTLTAAGFGIGAASLFGVAALAAAARLTTTTGVVGAPSCAQPASAGL